MTHQEMEFQGADLAILNSLDGVSMREYQFVLGKRIRDLGVPTVAQWKSTNP